MKTLTKSILVALALGAGMNSTLADPIGTQFTYQGQLQYSNVPVTGVYEFRFKLYADPLAQNPRGPLPPPVTLGVTNGLFSAALDFGVVFTGERLWLEVAVRPNGSALDFNVLSPLQELTPTPYAIYAENAASIGGITPGNFWGTAGNNVNANAKLGTTDAQPLVLIVGGQSALRFEPTGDTPN